MDIVLGVAYVVAGYWASGVVIYENKVVIHQTGALFMQRVAFAIVLGWALIPLSVLKRIFFR